MKTLTITREIAQAIINFLKKNELGSVTFDISPDMQDQLDTFFCEETKVQ